MQKWWRPHVDAWCSLTLTFKRLLTLTFNVRVDGFNLCRSVQAKQNKCVVMHDVVNWNCFALFYYCNHKHQFNGLHFTSRVGGGVNKCKSIALLIFLNTLSNNKTHAWESKPDLVRFPFILKMLCTSATDLLLFMYIQYRKFMYGILHLTSQLH